MIPIPVVWTKYTATVRGRVLKLVPCESCATEYVYVLEREGEGVGTSVYLTNEGGAADHAAAAADDTLRQYLENDFDPVPCPVCGHYQRYMFPKLYAPKSLWGPLAQLAVLVLGCLDTVSALYWSITCIQQPSDYSIRRMVVAWSLLAVLCFIGAGLAALERSKVRRFDPNTEEQQVRIERGQSRAVTWTEFEAAQQRQLGVEDSA